MEKFMEKELYRNIETLLNTYTLCKNKPVAQPLLNYEDFTDKEKQIVALVSHGLSNEQIADDLGITINTVRTHLSAIYSKTYFDINPVKNNTTNRVKLILYYLKFKGVLNSEWNIDIS